MGNVKYLKLNKENFFENSLDDFKRYQSVEECWRKKNGAYVLTPVKYIENWDLQELRQLAKRIITLVNDGSLAYGATADGKVIGFALLDKELFGRSNKYIDLAEFYVSEPYRAKGVGRNLFNMACRGAKELGAEKLYVSAHSAKESISVYESYGCTLAREINTALAEKERCDLQLEYDLTNPEIYEVTDKKSYLSLLLLADEQESMIDKYLSRGRMFVLDDGVVKGEIVVCDEGAGVLEIKNLAVLPEYRKNGYGRKLIEFVEKRFKGKYTVLQVGTGDSPLTVPFYEKCGFEKSRVVKNFFTDNYDHPIIEAGVRLTDMVYLKKNLNTVNSTIFRGQ